MTKFSKIVLMVFVLYFALFAFACKEEEKPIEEEKTPVLDISKTEFELMCGASERIDANIIDSTVALEIVYESKDSSIAVVEAGRLKALSAGETTIDAYLKDYADTKLTLTVKVNALPTVSVELDCDDEELYTNHTYQLKASISDNSSTSVTWESTDNTIATVDQNGLVSARVAGTVIIKATIGDYTGSITLQITKEPNQYVLNYNGGISQELYASLTPLSTLSINNFNVNFWGSYSTDVFVYNSNSNPTFSDRIYIGKNSNTSFYEVKSIVKSGSAVWPDNAEYEFVISNQHNSFAKLHQEVERLSVGDVVIINGDLKKASSSKPVVVNFYKAKLENEKLIFNKGEKIVLPKPIKEGNTFLGWVDEQGNPVTSVPTSIVGLTNIYASWFEIDPVTALNVSTFETDIETGTKFTITASVSPDNAYFKQVLFKTSNRNIISITDKGEVVAVNAGEATITVQDYVGKFVKEYKMVVNMIPSIDIKFADGFSGVLKVNDTVQLEPTLLGKASGTLTYASSDATVLSVDNSGKVTALKEGSAEITISAGSVSLKVGLTVNDLSGDSDVDKVIKLIAENNFAVADAGNACLYNDGRERYYKPTYGSVNRYLSTPLDINTKYTTTAANNASGHKDRRTGSGYDDSVYFVCVHDTATLTGTSEDIASYMAGGDVSIHYTVGNFKTWAVVPEDYIAYHAGDGTGTTFVWKDTGVKAVNNEKPTFTIVAKGSGYVYACNGQETTIPVPSTGTTPTTDELFTYLGPTWKIENGNYYMGLTWWSSSYGKISSHGGNNNSIGIEMNVNTSNDMYDTYQRTAKLVADILIRHNLDLTRVQMHNTFSGKNCAQAILAGNFWPRFMEMVSLEYELQTLYKDVKITFTPSEDSKNLIGADGHIKQAPDKTTTVSYDVTVSKGGVSKTIKLYTVIPGSTTWEQWSGTYLVTDIWNEGHFLINE